MDEAACCLGDTPGSSLSCVCSQKPTMSTDLLPLPLPPRILPQHLRMTDELTHRHIAPLLWLRLGCSAQADEDEGGGPWSKDMYTYTHTNRSCPGVQTSAYFPSLLIYSSQSIHPFLITGLYILKGTWEKSKETHLPPPLPSSHAHRQSSYTSGDLWVSGKPEL